MAFRTGTGKVVLCQSTHNAYKGSNWTYVPKSHVPCKSPQLETDIIGLVEERECITAAADEVLMSLLSSITMLTAVQHHAEWFILRKFRFTSSLAHTFISKVRCIEKDDLQCENVKLSTGTWELFQTVCNVVYGFTAHEDMSAHGPCLDHEQMQVVQHDVVSHVPQEQVTCVEVEQVLHSECQEAAPAGTVHGMKFCDTCGVCINDEHYKCSCPTNVTESTSTSTAPCAIDVDETADQSSTAVQPTVAIENNTTQPPTMHTSENIGMQMIESTADTNVEGHNNVNTAGRSTGIGHGIAVTCLFFYLIHLLPVPTIEFLSMKTMKYLVPLARSLKVKYAGKAKNLLVEEIHEALRDGRCTDIPFEVSNAEEVQHSTKSRKANNATMKEKKMKTVLESMFKAWFMSPLSGKVDVKEVFKMGSANEHNIFRAIPNFVRTYAHEFKFHIVRMYSFGLVSKVQSPWIATSPDGFAILLERFNVFGGAEVACPEDEPPSLVEESCVGALVEIKTVSSEDSIKHQESLVRRYGSICHVNIHDPMFCKLITTISYRYGFYLLLRSF